MKYNIAITTGLSIALGVVLYANGAGLIISILWSCILGFQASTWHMHGKTSAYNEIAEEHRRLERRLGVWN